MSAKLIRQICDNPSDSQVYSRLNRKDYDLLIRMAFDRFLADRSELARQIIWESGAIGKIMSIYSRTVEDIGLRLTNDTFISNIPLVSQKISTDVSSDEAHFRSMAYRVFCKKSVIRDIPDFLTNVPLIHTTDQTVLQTPDQTDLLTIEQRRKARQRVQIYPGKVYAQLEDGYQNILDNSPIVHLATFYPPYFGDKTVDYPTFFQGGKFLGQKFGKQIQQDLELLRFSVTNYARFQQRIQGTDKKLRLRVFYTILRNVISDRNYRIMSDTVQQMFDLIISDPIIDRAELFINFSDTQRDPLHWTEEEHDNYLCMVAFSSNTFCLPGNAHDDWQSVETYIGNTTDLRVLGVYFANPYVLSPFGVVASQD